MKFRFSTLLLISIATVQFVCGNELPPNRGTQLFIVIQGKSGMMHIIVMKPLSRAVFQEWNPRTGTYDFIRAAGRRTRDGSALSFIRFVMTDDYTAHVQRLDLVFPYSTQSHHRFFNIGSIVGFYRNSPDDFDAREFLWPHTISESHDNRFLDVTAASNSLSFRAESRNL
jgi:hypothetical protein